MIRVTPAAAAELRHLATPGRTLADPARPSTPRPLPIRLAPDGKGGLTMTAAAARPGDLVAAALAGPLDGLVFDVVARRLTVRPAEDEEPGDLIVAVAPPA